MDDHDDDHARDAHGDAHDDHDDHDDHGHGEEDAERVTAPMQQFSTAQVGLGAAVAVVGLLVTFGLPLLLV
jgi:hypothetical protein